MGRTQVREVELTRETLLDRPDYCTNSVLAILSNRSLRTDVLLTTLEIGWNWIDMHGFMGHTNAIHPKELRDELVALDERVDPIGPATFDINAVNGTNRPQNDQRSQMRSRYAPRRD